MALSGGIGATLSAMTAFSRHNARSDFRLSYIWWYIFRPIGGLIMGVVIYLFVVTNLIVLSVAPSSIDVRSILFYSAISFLGGFAFEQVAIKFNELASTLFAKKPKKEEQVMGEYRKRKDNNTWHWCKNCSNYPISNYTSRATKPKSGEFCIECKCRSKIEIEGN